MQVGVDEVVLAHLVEVGAHAEADSVPSPRHARR